MANELTDDDLTDEEDLTLEPQQAGLAFRAEMWAMDTLLGYWPYLVGTIAAVLGVIFFYGQYASFAQNQQRAAAKEIARVEVRLPGSRIGALAYAELSGEQLDVGELVQAATRIEAIEATGAARTEALLKAAELYRIAEQPEDQRRVLLEATETGSGVLAAVASTSVANLDLEAGETEAAIQRLQGLVKSHDDYLGEQAAMDLGLVLEQLERKSEAATVYTEFLERWPESPRAEDVRKRKSALGEG